MTLINPLLKRQYMYLYINLSISKGKFQFLRSISLYFENALIVRLKH